MKIIDLKISKDLKMRCPYARLGVVQAKVKYQKESVCLWEKINKEIKNISNYLSLGQIAEIPVIKDTRNAYLAMGKEPARYRCSAEALLRRIVNGKGLYKINSIVDIINFISLSSHFSIGCYDYNTLFTPVIFDIGRASEKYNTIGRGEMNIEDLPVFRDGLGAFGSPTSDSSRTRITINTREIVAVIIDFSGTGSLIEAMNMTVDYLKEYGGATQTVDNIVK